MKVYSAIMMDENKVADHNCPDLLVAAHPGILLSLVREYVKDYPHWLEAIGVNVAEVDTMSIEDMNMRLSGGDAEGNDIPDWEGVEGNLFIHNEEHEV